TTASVLRHANAHLPATLHGAHDDGLLCGAGLASEGAARSTTAEVRFVGFHDACEHLSHVVAHRGADAMAHVPRGLVRDLEHPLELVGRDAFLGLAHDVDREEPLPQW